MTVKAGVDIRGIRAELVFGLQVAEEIFRGRGLPLVVTSVCDGTHMAGSLHYKGLAADLRTSVIPTMHQPMVVSELKAALGAQWDVVLENTHIHMEFDPK